MRKMEAPLSPFLALMKEKEGCFLRERRAICQVAGDNHASEKSTRQTALLSIWGFFLMRKMEAPLSPFLALMQEKETKENQGIRDACQVCRVLQTKQRGSCQVAGDNHALEKSTRQTSLPSAEGLSLMKEMEAKENQGIRDACQVCRIP